MLATLENEKSLNNVILEQVTIQLPKALRNMIDILGVSIINSQRKKCDQIKHIFNMSEETERHGKYFTVPDPKNPGEFITVETY